VYQGKHGDRCNNPAEPHLKSPSTASDSLACGHYAPRVWFYSKGDQARDS
jgi:hypothetical protein